VIGAPRAVAHRGRPSDQEAIVRTPAASPAGVEASTVPGGPILTSVDGPLLLRRRSVSEMDNNVIVLACARTRQALIVDAADDAEAIRELVADLLPLAVVQTHGHWDHVRAWTDLAADPGLEVWGHEGDLALYPHPPDRLLADGQQLQIGDVAVEVLHVPGHTEGSLLFLAHGAERAWLVSGDTLFPGGPGSTQGDLGRHATVMDGLEQRVFARLQDTTVVLPGHGDTTTIGRERPDLREWRERGW
jgi:glyoxylase-like metal-dependent hydrolase (beta-lactamase superfamily II)